jgi:hypothetical protein
MDRSIFIGYDAREAEAFAVCRASIRRHLTSPIPIRSLILSQLRIMGFYRRPTEFRDGRLWDAISQAPMATEFAISRFLTPILAQSGWALFMDCDMLALDNLVRVFELADPQYAVMCVKHRHEPAAGQKMDGQLQTFYRRKNWSSFCLYNCDHPANAALTVDMVNSLPGRDLHAFSWLQDEDIGALHPAWNFLVGHTDPIVRPHVIHWTDGGPWFPKYADAPHAAEWRAERDRWAA